MVLRKTDGLVISEHSDGTRITIRPSSINNGSSLVTLEHPLFARVTYESRDCCRLDLPSNIQVMCRPLGEYEIKENDTIQLNISSKGCITYHNPKNERSSYALSHTGEESVLKAKDCLGWDYSVSYSDGISITKSAATDEERRASCDRFLPRIFVMDRDGSGFQLCNKRDVEEFINETRGHSVVTTDKLPQCPDISTTTVISTDVNQYSSKGVLPYAEDTIVPKNLKCHNTAQKQQSHELSQAKKKRFGVGVGKSLSIGSYVPLPPAKVFKRPKGMKYRQFIDFTGCGLREELLAVFNRIHQLEEGEYRSSRWIAARSVRRPSQRSSESPCKCSRAEECDITGRFVGAVSESLGKGKRHSSTTIRAKTEEETGQQQDQC